jgi:hypothetical protein
MEVQIHNMTQDWPHVLSTSKDWPGTLCLPQHSLVARWMVGFENQKFNTLQENKTKKLLALKLSV